MEDETIGQQIANGHAWDSHKLEFDVADREDFVDLIDGIVLNPNDRKQFDDDKMAYWDNDEQAIVITNPNDPDGGTAFKPDRGKAYFDEL